MISQERDLVMYAMEVIMVISVDYCSMRNQTGNKLDSDLRRRQIQEMPKSSDSSPKVHTSEVLGLLGICLSVMINTLSRHSHTLYWDGKD